MTIWIVRMETQKHWRKFLSESLRWWWYWFVSSYTSLTRQDSLKTDLNFWIIQVNVAGGRKEVDEQQYMMLIIADNVSSYQSVSPADTSLPIASPSPVANMKASSSSSSSQYDRSKLSIPLQPCSSSRSPSPVGSKSPSYLDNNLIHPSVARSLRNIKQTNNDIQPLELELDLNNKLF